MCQPWAEDRRRSLLMEEDPQKFFLDWASFRFSAAISDALQIEQPSQGSVHLMSTLAWLSGRDTAFLATKNGFLKGPESQIATSWNL